MELSNTQKAALKETLDRKAAFSKMNHLEQDIADAKAGYRRDLAKRVATVGKRAVQWDAVRSLVTRIYENSASTFRSWGPDARLDSEAEQIARLRAMIDELEKEV